MRLSASSPRFWVGTRAEPSPDASSCGAEPLRRLAIGPRVVRALGEIERDPPGRALLGSVENLEQQLRRDGLRTDEELIEAVLGPDVEHALRAQVAGVDLLVDEVDGDAGPALAVREHPEAGHHAAI